MRYFLFLRMTSALGRTATEWVTYLVVIQPLSGHSTRKNNASLLVKY